MPVRLIEIVSEAGNVDTLSALAEQYKALDFRADPAAEDGTRMVRLLAHPDRQQELIDRIQSGLGKDKPWRVTILPVDATIPDPEPSEEARASAGAALREQLYVEVARSARVDANFLLLVLLSTVVAAIGLFEDSVTIIIAAMVIAPLLGPNIALAFGSALGDRELILRAAATSAIGIALSVAGAAAAGLVLPHRFSGVELISRTTIGYDSIAIALASGTAGALSLVTRLSSTLVGVMVAVALLPPAATLGYMLGTGRFALAAGAAALLAANVVGVNLSAQLVFLARGIKPRTWLERRAAQESTAISILVWSVLLAAILAIVYLRQV